jgi:hypothetical protein
LGELVFEKWQTAKEEKKESTVQKEETEHVPMDVEIVADKLVVFHLGKAK